MQGASWAEYLNKNRKRLGTRNDNDRVAFDSSSKAVVVKGSLVHMTDAEYRSAPLSAVEGMRDVAVTRQILIKIYFPDHCKAHRCVFFVFFFFFSRCREKYGTKRGRSLQVDKGEGKLNQISSFCSGKVMLVRGPGPRFRVNDFMI